MKYADKIIKRLNLQDTTLQVIPNKILVKDQKIGYLLTTISFSSKEMQLSPKKLKRIVKIRLRNSYNSAMIEMKSTITELE